MNPIRKKLSSHAAKGYSRITAAEADLKEIYLRARDHVERQLATFLQQKNASFTGPRLVSLFDDISAYFSDFEQEYCERYEEALSYMAKQNYAVALHDMGLEENIVGRMDKALFENMKADAFTHIAGATKRMQTDVISNLRKMSAKVMREASLTGMTRSEVSRKLAFENGYGTGSLFQQPGKKGSDFQFIDAAGKQWKTDAYFNMLGRTLLHNNARECYLAGCAKAGSDIVTISISGDPCEVCAKYENTLLSISGRTKGLVTLEQAMAEGLFHPNCTHRMVAVPESVAKEYYTESGEEKAEKDVAWEKKLATQELKQTKKKRSGTESHEEHFQRRKEQEQRALNNRVVKWEDSMIKQGVPEEVRTDFIYIYRKYYKAGKPPVFVWEKAKYRNFRQTNTSFMSADNTEMHIVDSEWSSSKPTRHHEFAHWLHRKKLNQNKQWFSKIEDAAVKDLNTFEKNLGSLTKEELANYFSQRYFSMDYNSLENDQLHIVVGLCDSVGSISNGKFGFGHPEYSGKLGSQYYNYFGTKNYYRIQNNNNLKNPNLYALPYGEAIANIISAMNFCDVQKLKLDFPQLCVIVKEMEAF